MLQHLLQVLNNGCHYTAIKAIAMVDDFEQEVLTRYSDHGQGSWWLADC